MPRESVKDQIIAAAVEALHSKGFNGTSVQDITDAAKVPKGSFYNHFESKEELAVAALDRYWQWVLAGVQPLPWTARDSISGVWPNAAVAANTVPAA